MTEGIGQYYFDIKGDYLVNEGEMIELDEQGQERLNPIGNKDSGTEGKIELENEIRLSERLHRYANIGAGVYMGIANGIAGYLLLPLSRAYLQTGDLEQIKAGSLILATSLTASIFLKEVIDYYFEVSKAIGKDRILRLNAKV